MRILLLTHAFNSLTQRLWAELAAAGHELSVEFDIADPVSEEAVALFNPQLIVAPYLRRAIPASVWANHVCLVVHPGPVGDRGPSALDRAIQGGETEWGLTVLQAEAEMDAGPVWASTRFPLRAARKGSVYRNEVTEAAARAVRLVVERFARGEKPERPAQSWWRPLVTQAERAIDWRRDPAAMVLAKINAADGFPGVADSLFGAPCRLFDAWPEAHLRGAAGEVIARRETALLRATVDGAVWIGHVKREPTGARAQDGIKLPATLAFAEEARAVPEVPLAALELTPAGGKVPLAAPPGLTFAASPVEPPMSVFPVADAFWQRPDPTWQDIGYAEDGDIGVLRFEFYNGAMSTRQCERLREALAWAKTRPVKVLVLTGGADFWSNGIHLNVIEQAAIAGGSAADESWRNIDTMNELTRELIETPAQITIAAVAGNAGAGGCFLAGAADCLWLREGAILNPHYRNMGNLYGSEYWTYLLPKRVGEEGARRLMADRLPLDAARAVAIGFADAALSPDRAAFAGEVLRRAREIAAAPDFAKRIEAKRAARARDEAQKPLAAYRAEEMAHMRRNFYGFDPSYHVARFHFVSKSLASWTPRHLARHRELGWNVPK